MQKKEGNDKEEDKDQLNIRKKFLFVVFAKKRKRKKIEIGEI